jgi:Protein of unknown function (DUF1615)
MGREERVSMNQLRSLLPWTLLLAVSLAACASKPPEAQQPAIHPADARTMIDAAIPRSVSDRAGWAADVYAAFSVLSIDPSHENICAVTAVIEQESGFQVDPLVPDLGVIAWREIDKRADRIGMPRMVVHGLLQLTSPNGRSYAARIDSAKTEKQLSDVYEDFIGSVPLGRTLFESKNPIRTRGPMQVNVVFAQQFAAVRPYPYPVKVSISDELFTRRGSVYFGTAHLLAYSAPYDRYLYRFADYNAGQYASRNAAFQRALSSASGIPLLAEGALLPHDDDAKGAGSTELAARSLSKRLGLDEGAIHASLEQGKTREFERTALYRQVFALAERAQGRPLSREQLPQIKLQGPKIQRKLTTDWYAHRVDERFKGCLNR